MSNEKEMTPKQLLECMDTTMKVANCYLANLAFNAAGLQADDLKKQEAQEQSHRQRDSAAGPGERVLGGLRRA